MSFIITFQLVFKARVNDCILKTLRWKSLREALRNFPLKHSFCYTVAKDGKVTIKYNASEKT